MNIQHLTPDAFAPYGTLIRYTAAKNDGWEIVIRSDSQGWRIALLEFDRKETNRLEYHPESKETFEPIEGVALLLVAPHDTPEAVEVFVLDQPICLNQGIWHQVISLSEKTLVKITENLDVDCVYYDFDTPFRPYLEKR